MVLDARGVCNFADYFVLCTAESDRQTRAIYEEIEFSLKKQGVRQHHYEGKIGSGWLLLDYGDTIVHIFSPEERSYYQLDSLWDEAEVLLHMQ